MSESMRERRRETRGYVIGYLSALVLTGAAFATVRWPSFGSVTTLSVVFTLALVQMLVHFRCFLHVGFDRASRDNLQLIVFSSLIIALMVSGTLVLMFNLRGRMM